MKTKKYDINRQQSLDDSCFRESDNPRGRQASPSEEAMRNERWSNLTRDLCPRDRRILEMRRVGANNQEIAAELNINERTVRRVLDRLRPD